MRDCLNFATEATRQKAANAKQPLKIRAVFLDVDGTLISFATHRIPASALDALARAHAGGVRVFIATGRAATDIAQLDAIPYDGVVALNGADCLLRDGVVVARHVIPQADFDRVMALAAEYDFSVALELDEGMFVDRLTSGVEQWAATVAHPVPTVTDVRALFARTACRQLCLFFDMETEARVMAQLPNLTASRWSPVFVNANVRGVDKASGMRAMLAHYGIPVEAAAAIGDGGNDVTMLRAAGLGIAMGNACAEALDAADWVTASVDEHGIARALEYMEIL